MLFPGVSHVSLLSPQPEPLFSVLISTSKGSIFLLNSGIRPGSVPHEFILFCHGEMLEWQVMIPESMSVVITDYLSRIVYSLH